jgi:hypothetical protein
MSEIDQRKRRLAQVGAMIAPELSALLSSAPRLGV